MKVPASTLRGLSFLPLRTPLLRRLFRLRSLEPLPLALVARRIYILPTRQGLVFCLLLLGMLLGSMNYGLSMGFLFTFLLAGMVLSALFATWRTLLGLTLLSIEPESGFAGDQVHFSLHLRLPDLRSPQGVFLESGGIRAELASDRKGTAQVRLSLPARQRGRQRLGPSRLFTEAPLGLFHAWCVFAPAAAALVWPKPALWQKPLPTTGGLEKEQSVGSQRGTEDFDGLATYRPGESPSRLVWKSMGRLDEPLVKAFIAPQGDVIWLDWAQLQGLEMEARLSQLARWVLEADRLNLVYGLNLPGSRVAPASGPPQRLRCLNALALHGQPPDEDHAQA
jgi:uncharacterized protein (DUF58 family)